MERVYGNSYLNLAAVDSKDGNGGLFRDRRPSALAPSMIKCRSRRNFSVIRDDFFEEELLSQPLYRRGWAFQGMIIRCYQVLTDRP